MTCMSLTDALTGHAIRLSLTGSFEVRFAGDGPASFDDYEDLAGPDIGAILGKVGWRYGGAVTRVDAFPAAGPAQLPVASAWATPIVMPTGERGINISYGVGSSHRGKGLAALLAYVAVGECRALQTLRFRPEPTFVNVQARSCNEHSQDVARALRIEQDPAAAFDVRLRDGQALTFVGFRDDLETFLDRGLARTAERLEGYEPGLLTAAAASRDRNNELGPRLHRRGHSSPFDKSYGDSTVANGDPLHTPR